MRRGTPEARCARRGGCCRAAADRCLRQVVAAAILAVGVGASAAAQECGFKWSNSYPPEIPLEGMTYGDGKLVGVGEHGTVIVSTDGEHWQWHDTGTDDYLLDVAWSEQHQLFVAVGSSEAIFTSPDAEVWTERHRGAWFDFEWVECGTQACAATQLSSSEGMAVSSDAVTWAYLGPHSAIAVTWNGAWFLVLTASGFYRGSADGLTWEYLGPAPQDGKAPSGARPAKGAYPGKWKALAWDGSQFVYLHWDSGVYTSPDGVTWQLRHKFFPSWDRRTWNASLLAADGKLVATIASDDLDMKQRTRIHVSSDGGGTWVEAWSDRGEGFPGLAWDGTRFYAAGDGGDILRSGDGLVWSPLGADSLGSVDTTRLYDLVVTPDRVVVVGGVFIPDWPNTAEILGVVATSADGVTWHQHEVQATALRGVVYNGSLYVAVGHGYACVSSNGETWQTVPFPDWYTVSSVAWGAGLFVGVGSEGVILTSPDGLAWTRRHQLDYDDYLRRVVFGAGRFVAVGDHGLVKVSGDGVSWTVVNVGEQYYLRDVIYTGSWFLAVGLPHVMLESTDGLTCTRVGEPPYWLNALAFNGEQYVAGAGGSGLVTVDRRHWTDYLLQPLSGGVTRALWSGQEFWLVGEGRAIHRATCFGNLVSAEPSELQLEVGQSAGITITLGGPATPDVTLTVGSWWPEAVGTPATVTIPAGSDSTTFDVTGLREVMYAQVRATLPADLGGGAATTMVTVTAATQRQQIPTLSPLGVLTLVVLIAGGGLFLLRRSSGV